MNQSKKDIFISYASADKFEALKIAQKLEQRNITYFLASKSLQAGSHFQEEIRENLIQCEELFLLLTPNGLKSEWVHLECGAAWALGKHISPILFKCQPDDLPTIVTGLQAVHIEDLDRTIDDFEERQRNKKRNPTLLATQQSIDLTSEGRYYIGIDIGKATINYCLFDYESFSGNIYSHDEEGALYSNSIKTPASFDEIYSKIKKIIEEIAFKARERKIFSIHGIGIGLPGMVDPKEGMLVHTPSFNLRKLRFKAILEKIINWRGDPIKNLIPDGGKNIPIEIDNDVRCATRWRWLRHSPEAQSLVCIFIGNGLGSGIVVNGKMLYGKHFFAGEAGHTTISSQTDFFKSPLEKCHCERKGHHWEMHVCSYGIIHLMKTLDTERFAQLEEKYVHRHSKKSLTYPLAEAFYDGDPYAGEIVDKFFEHVAIGVANYVYILNPQEIVLGGGMIRAFHSRDKASPFFKRTTHDLLLEKIREYITPSFDRDYLTIDFTPKQYLSSLGAALIFKDNSYFEYKHQ